MEKIIYNISLKVEKEISGDWIHWLFKTYIPEMMGTGCFEKFNVYQLLDTGDEDGPTYIVQFHASRDQYQFYIDNHSSWLRKQSFDKWGHKVLSFRSLMQLVQ